LRGCKFQLLNPAAKSAVKLMIDWVLSLFRFFSISLGMKVSSSLDEDHCVFASIFMRKRGGEEDAGVSME
jgi:hypothetical protein